MEQSPWEGNSHSARQGTSGHLLNPKIHNRVDKSLPLFLVQSQMNQSTSFRPNSLRSILTLPSHLRLGLPSGLFPSGFPTKLLYIYIYQISPMRATCRASHPPWSNNSDKIFRSVQVTKSLIMQSSPASHHFFPFRSKYSPVLKYPQSVLLP